MSDEEPLDWRYAKDRGIKVLVKRLASEGVLVTEPVKNSNADLVVHDSTAKITRPLLVRVSTRSRVCIYEKYLKTPDLRVVFIWFEAKNNEPRIFVMTYEALYKMFLSQGHLQTPSWVKGRGYSTTNASGEKLLYMKFYEAGHRTLRELIFN